MNKRLFIVFVLGLSSGLPLTLITSTLQAWFADVGLPVVTTGMLSLAGLPYVFRPLWAPFVDRYSLLSIGKRRSWILVMQVLLCLGFNAMAWFSPVTSPVAMMVLAVVLATCSATQDLAIDAQRIEYLPISLHGLGASLYTVGYRLALILAGGFSLIIAHYAGWPVAYRLMGLFMLCGMAAILLSSEPSKSGVSTAKFTDDCIDSIKELISRPHIFSFFAFIFFYKMGEAFTTTTSGIMMPFLIQEIGFSLDTVAYVNKIIGVGAIVLGGITAGFLLLRWSLYRALFVFGVLQAVTNVLFIVLATVGHHLPTFIFAVISDNFSAGMASTALVVLFMKCVDRRFTATQFSLFVAFSTLPRILSGPLGAMLHAYLGWVGLYEVAFALSLGFVPFIMAIKLYL